jgi:hypothetical protein
VRQARFVRWGFDGVEGCKEVERSFEEEWFESGKVWFIESDAITYFKVSFCIQSQWLLSSLVHRVCLIPYVVQNTLEFING